MQDIDLSQYSDSDGFTLVFYGATLPFDWKTVNETMKGLTQAAKAIGAVIDPDFDIELEISGLMPGSVKLGVSFQKKLSATATALLAAGATQIAPVPHDYIGSVLLASLYQRVDPSEFKDVRSNDKTVTLVGPSSTLTMTHEAYQFVPKLQKNRKLSRGVRRVLLAAHKNHAITSVGLTCSLDHEAPTFVISRPDIDVLFEGDAPRRAVTPMDTRALSNGITAYLDRPKGIDVIETQIVFLSPVSGKPNTWRCVWNGRRITATITDPDYLIGLSTLLIPLRRGSSVHVELTISRKFSRAANTWIDKSYEITKLHTQKLGPLAGFNKQPNQPSYPLLSSARRPKLGG